LRIESGSNASVFFSRGIEDKKNMLSNILKKGLLSTNPSIYLPRYASTSGQQTVLVVLYEGLI